MKMKIYKDVDSYVKDFPKETANLLKQIRAAIKKAAPYAEETMSYGMPAYKLNGPVVYFGGFKKHVSLFPTSSGVRIFHKELSRYQTSKGTIQFPLNKPLPLSLISKIVKLRVKENTQKESVKSSSKKFIKYHNDGTPWAKGKITAGKMEGYWEWLRKDGSKMRSGYFKKGVQTGTWTTYDKKGRVVKTTKFT